MTTSSTRNCRPPAWRSATLPEKSWGAAPGRHRRVDMLGGHVFVRGCRSSPTPRPQTPRPSLGAERDFP